MSETKVPFKLRGHNPDVLTCIANLSNDEVFTPPEFANRMLDTLGAAWAESNKGESIWENPEVTFLDPFTKSGVFLREITTRLIEGLEQQIPDLQERVDHILTKQVFGIAITELTSLLARRSLYCSKFANGKHSVATSFTTEQGNIWFERTEHAWTGGTQKTIIDPLNKVVQFYVGRRCKFCGAAEGGYERGDDLETHAYDFIHTDNIKARIVELFGGPMQFDVIIGNPPYQLSDGGYGTSAAPIYHHFVEQAKRLDPRFLSMVIPARWYAGGKGLDSFRAEMLKDNRIRELHDFPNTNDVFPGVNNRGGICYFIWDKHHADNVLVKTYEKNIAISTMSRPLLERGMTSFIRYNEGIEILKRVVSKETAKETNLLTLPEEKKFVSLVSARNPFGLPTNFIGSSSSLADGNYRVFRNGKPTQIKPELVTSGATLAQKFKVFISRASPGTDDYPHLVLSKPIIGYPGDISTDTYITIGPFQNEDECKNVALYMSTIFFRFMLTLLRTSLNVTRNVYELVPIQDWSVAWDDKKLAAKYDISEQDFNFMLKFVKPVSWGASSD